MSESLASLQADNRVPPRSSATPGVGVTAIAVTTTSAGTDLWDKTDQPYTNSNYYDRYVDIVSIGADSYILFSETAAVAINEATMGNGVGVPGFLPAGVAQPYRLSQFDRFINLKTATGTATVRIIPSSEPAPFRRQMP